MKSQSPWLAFESPSYRALWAGALVSNVGTWLERVAVGVYVAQTTGRSGWSGLAAAALFLPSLVTAPIGGVLADRFPRRRFLLAATMAQTVVSGTMTVLAYTHTLSMPALLVLLVATGCASTMMYPGFNALLTEVVPPHAVGSSIFLNSGQFNIARVVGPLVCASVIAVSGVEAAFALNTLSFAAIVPVLVRLPPPTHTAPPEPFWQGLKSGVRAATEDSGVLSALLLAVLGSALIAPFIGLIPIFTLRELGSDAAGASLLLSMQGVGAVIAALASSALVSRYGYRRWIGASSMMVAIVAALFWLAPSVVLAAVAVVFLGGAFLAMMTGTKTVCLSRTASVTRGRVSSLYSGAVDASYGVGITVIGALGDVVGLRLAALLGCAGFLGAVWYRRSRTPETMDVPATAPAVVALPDEEP